jgi:ribosomal protein S18 acetylase RimI-like enzyme
MENIRIVDYHKGYQPHFEKLNRAWIEKHFFLEESDKLVLLHPEEAIIARGGAILMALYDEEVAGTVALKKAGGKTFEFTKMAVDERFRRKGIGEALSIAAIGKAKEWGAEKLILYSQTQLEAAIFLYRKLGFREVPLEPGIYQRANIKMQMILTPTNKFR